MTLALPILLTLAASAPNSDAIAEVRPESLADKVQEAAYVYHLRILSIDEHFAVRGQSKELCETSYSARVIDTLKGSTQEQIVLTTDSTLLPFSTAALKVGDQLLVLLTSESHSIVNSELSGVGNGTSASPAAASDCPRQLGAFNLTPSNESAFLLIRDPQDSTETSAYWLRFMRSRTAMPDDAELEVRLHRADCGAIDCEKSSFRLVRWVSLRKWIVSWVAKCRG